MKRFHIITSQIEKTASWPEREKYVQEFCAALQERVDNIEVLYTTYQELNYSVIDQQLAIFDTHNQLDLNEVDLVHFKNWTYEYEEAALVAFYLRKHEITYYNAEVGIKAAIGKTAQMFYLAAENIPVPNSFFAHRRYLRQLFASGKTPAGFDFPLIMKADDGSRGDNNHLVKTAEQAVQIIDESEDVEFILQNFIPNDGDFRCLLVGVGSSPLLFRRTAVAGSHLNNTSKGGSGELVDSATLPAEYLAYARKASEVLGREIGGVDIIVDKETNKPYILEVNGTPAIATGYAVDKKVDLFVDFLEQFFDVTEEE